MEDVGRAGAHGSPGAYGWGSALEGLFFVDPAEDLVAVYLAQLFQAPDGGFRPLFGQLVYQAIVGSPPRRAGTPAAPRAR